MREKKIDINKYITENISNSCLIYGTLNQINIENNNKEIIKKNIDILSDSEILEIFDKNIMLKNHQSLNDHLIYLKNDKMIDRLVFGKDLNKAILNYKIKTLYCSEEMYHKVKNVFPKQYLNFEIIKITSFEDADIGDILKKDYKGIIGITYY
jgi:hypothetical protein